MIRITGKSDELNDDTVMVYRWYWFERVDKYTLIQCVRMATEFSPRIVGKWTQKKWSRKF